MFCNLKNIGTTMFFATIFIHGSRSISAKENLLMSSRNNLFRLYGGNINGKFPDTKNNDKIEIIHDNSTDNSINDCITTDLNTLYTPDTIHPEFPIVSKTLVYDGWRKITRKEIHMPNKAGVMFDVITQKSPSVVVFIWDRVTSTSTLVQEYHPGVEKMMYGVVAGIY